MHEINAAIVKHEERIWCCFRTDHLFKFNALSFLSQLDENLSVISIRRLFVENANTAFEDVRLFSHNGKLLAFYSYFPLGKDRTWSWNFGVGLGVVDLEYGIIKAQQSLRFLSQNVEDKNWVPYQFNNELYAITDMDPYLRIVKINLDDFNESMEFFKSKIKLQRWKYGEIRGGTAFLQCPFEEEWFYGFVHSHLSNYKGYDRYYFCTVARFNPWSKIFEYGQEPIIFDELDEGTDDSVWNARNAKRKVIFPIGIMNYEDGVMVSFGRDDRDSFTEYYTWDFLLKLFIIKSC